MQGWKMQVRKNQVQIATENTTKITLRTMRNNRAHTEKVLQYIQHSWLLKATIGSQRLSVSGSTQRTNNSVESFQDGFRRLKVSHPSFYGFVEYLQEVTLSNMADVQRLNTSRRIRRPKK